MKKIISILICIVLSMACFTVNAASGAIVQAGNVSGSVGEEVSVDVTLSNNVGFSNIALEIEYDVEALTLTGVASANVGATFTKAQSYSENPYNMSWDATENVNFNGTLATLTFKVNEAAKDDTYPIKVSYYKGRNGNYTDGYDVNYDENFESLNLSYVNGSITVANGENPTEPPTEKPTDDNGATRVYVTEATGAPAEDVSVSVVLENNTGFSNIALEIEYDTAALTLTGAASANVGATFTKAQNYSENPYNMSWDATENVAYNGALATLAFKVNEGAKVGTYPIKVSYYKGRDGNYTDGYDVNYDENFESLNLEYVAGAITVTDGIPEIKNVEVDGKVVTAELSGAAEGQVIAALYDDNDVMLESRICAASEAVSITFEKTGSYVKIMWLENNTNIKPMCEAKEISLK